MHWILEYIINVFTTYLNKKFFTAVNPAPGNSQFLADCFVRNKLTKLCFYQYFYGVATMLDIVVEVVCNLL